MSYNAEYTTPDSEFTDGPRDTLHTGTGDMYDNHITDNNANYAWLIRDDPSTYPITQNDPLQLIYTPSEPEAVTHFSLWHRDSPTQYVSRYVKVSGQNGTTTPVELTTHYQPIFSDPHSTLPVIEKAHFNFTFNQNSGI